MPTELIKQLLEAGVHFGHKASRWNPKMRRFIFGERSSIYIIDLQKTEDCLNKARDFLLNIVSKGEMVLFVGTKKQAQEIVKQEALRCGMYYVTERWPGGLLTNFLTIKKRINRLKEIEKMSQDGIFAKLTKKEVASLENELAKLKKNFSGIVHMDKLPKAIFIIDTKKEETAVREARRLDIPIVSLIDTNSDPTLVEYPIPGNDDATKSVKLIVSLIADTIIEGRKRFLSYLSESGAQSPKSDSQQQEAEITVDEEEKIKEIAEVIDESLEKKEKDKELRKGHSKPEEDKKR